MFTNTGFAQAFVTTKVASVTLVEAWVGKTQDYHPVVAMRSRAIVARWSSGWLLSVLMVALSFLLFPSTTVGILDMKASSIQGFAIITSVSVFGFLFYSLKVYVVDCGRADRKFLKDCHKLSRLIADPGALTLEQLRTKAYEKLLSEATELARFERDYPIAFVDHKRTKFDEDYNTMGRFGLVDDADAVSIYFYRAREILAQEPPILAINSVRPAAEDVASTPSQKGAADQPPEASQEA